MTDIVTVKNLTKDYGGFVAVDGVNFCIKRGEIFGFLGPNGAGKTSTINMMIGLSRPTDGSITINGIDARKYPKKAQAVMGIVPDESNLYDEMNGFDNLCFCAALYGMKKAAREEKAKQLLDQFKLTSAGDRPFKKYSKGMRRKLTIAAGIIHSPQILFLDEPTTGIDVESARQIRELILGLKDQGTTVFITTHYIEDAERICDKIAFIVSGKIVAEGSVAELMKNAADGCRLQITAEENIEGFSEVLQARFAGSSVSCTQGNILTITSPERIPLSPVIQFFEEKHVPVFEAKELRPSLEDVFVRITGIEKSKLLKEKGA